MRTPWKTPLGVVTVLLSVGLGRLPSPASALEVGDKAPGFLTHRAVGEIIRLPDYQGE